MMPVTFDSKWPLWFSYAAAALGTDRDRSGGQNYRFVDPARRATISIRPSLKAVRNHCCINLVMTFNDMTRCQRGRWGSNRLED